MALKKFAVNMAALTGARVLQAVSGFVAIPLLARLLSPAEFGLIAMASAFVWFTSAISDAGLGQTLVRIDRREREVWSSAFWFLTLIGLVLASFLVIIAFPVAWLMHEPELAAVVLALAPIPLVQAASAPLIADLQQREQFRALASADLSGSLCGIGLAIALALNGAGVWALVGQQIGNWAVRTAMLVAATTFRPGLTFKFSLLGPHIVFSRDTGILGLVSFFAHQVDPIVIGRMLGAAAVGIYSIGGRIAALPMQFLSSPLNNLLFTRMVLLREDREASRDLIFIATWIVAAIAFPAMAVVAAASPAFFEVFLTAKWIPAAPVFVAFAPVICLQAILSIAGSMLLAIGATGKRLRLAVEFMVLWVIVLPFAAMHSALAVAIAYTVSYFAFSVRRYPIYLDVIGATPAAYFGNIMPPICVALAAAAVMWAIVAVIPLTPMAQIAVSAGVLACAYAVLAVLERKRLAPRIATMREVLSDRGASFA